MDDAPKPKDGLARPSRRVKIEVPEAYKRTSDEVWEELEKYLFTGFVHSPAYVAGHSFVFKSLNHYEIRNIEFMRASRSAPAEARASFRRHFIAHSIFMIDGRNMLFERPKNINRLVNVVGRIPPAIQDKIVENLAALNSKAHRLYPLTEAFVHENRSRFKWLQTSSMPIHSVLATGIPGTDELGMNYAQQTWVALNRVQDKREDVERDWANAKFIGSTMSKGVRAVDERDRARAERERSELEDLKLKVLYNYLNRVVDGSGPPDRVQLPDGRMASVDKKFRAESVEDLADQLSAALSGEKDHHDVVVEAQLAKLKQRAAAIESQQRKMYSAPMPTLPAGGETSASGGTRVIGGRAEAEAHLARIMELRQKQMEAVRAAAPSLDSRDESSDGASGSGGSPGR